MEATGFVCLLSHQSHDHVHAGYEDPAVIRPNSYESYGFMVFRKSYFLNQNTCERETLNIKTKVDDLYLYLKHHSFTGILLTFC